MPTKTEIHCHQCAAAGDGTRSTYGGTIPDGWMMFQGASANASNLVIHLCPSCAPKPTRPVSFLDSVGGPTFDPA